MKVTGIIAEYNPFHKGHAYHIEQARIRTNADYIIVVMSGNFVQRGEPAIIDKYSRTKMALLEGADLVLELPVYYATASAELFAAAAVSMLASLGCVDFLCFGSEDDEILAMDAIAKVLVSEPYEYQTALKSFLSAGNSFPKAREAALSTYFETHKNCQINNNFIQKLNQPNNILSLEYLKSLNKYHYSISPVAVKRSGQGYHSEELSDYFSSATSIRKAVLSDLPFAHYEATVPASVMEVMKTKYHKSFPVVLEDFDLIFSQNLLLYHNDFDKYLDFNEEMARRLSKKHLDVFTISEATSLLKTKNLTYTRIHRALLHLILQIKTDSVMTAYHNELLSYCRVLGMRKSAFSLLKKIRAYSSHPLIQKTAKADELLSPFGKSLWKMDLYASHLYSRIVYHKFGSVLPNEFRCSPIIIDGSQTDC